MLKAENRRFLDVLQSIKEQPSWRNVSDKCYQYYDGNQIDKNLKAELKAKKLPIIVNNIIAPTINGVLGMEARSRTDWFVKADNDEFVDTAEALNERLNEALRTAKANRACSDAYKDQIIAGIGWVEVRRNHNPMGSKYIIQRIPRREMSWDWRSDTYLSNCRWVMREKWVDKDELIYSFPNKKEVINRCANNWDSLDADNTSFYGNSFDGAYAEFSESDVAVSDYLNQDKNQIKVYELHYVVYETALVIFDETGSATKLDEHNPIHLALVSSGKVNIEKRRIKSMRVSWFAGVHLLHDGASSTPDNMFPYIPFWGMREDNSGVPYGLVRTMISPQEELNFRRSKLTAQLIQKRIIMDDDATKMSDYELQRNVQNSEGIVKLNPNARREGGGRFEVQTESNLSSQQFTVMQDSKNLIQESAGVFNAMLGKETSGQSGVAINSLVEQGATTLADINDNYRNSRQAIGELILAYEVAELKQQKNVSITISSGKYKAQPKTVVINSSEGEVNNDLARIKTQVVLGEIQQSQGYRAQVTQMVMQFMSQLPEQARVLALDMVLDQIDMPEDKKDRLQGVIDKLTGEGEQGVSEAQAKQQEQMQRVQSMQIQLEMEKLKSQIEEIQSKAYYTQAKGDTEKHKQAEIAHNLNETAPPPLPEDY